MLILARRRGESIMIGDDIEVRVIDIGDGKVRLGFTGPASRSVHRRERYEATLQEQGSRARRAPEHLPVT